MKNTSACENCHFFKTFWIHNRRPYEYDDETDDIYIAGTYYEYRRKKQGRCHRYPPVFLDWNNSLTPNARYEEDWRFPLVSDSDVCGEWKAKIWEALRLPSD